MSEYIAVAHLRGVCLRYFVAQALAYSFKLVEPTYGVGHRIHVQGAREYFRPDVDWTQLGPLLETHWREINAWLLDYFGPNWQQQVDGTTGALQRWFCIALVGAKLGNRVVLPDELLGSHESLSRHGETIVVMQGPTPYKLPKTTAKD